MDTAPASSLLLTSEEVMKHVNVSRSTLWRLRRRKRDPLPYIRIGRLIRYPWDKLVYWTENQGFK